MLFSARINCLCLFALMVLVTGQLFFATAQQSSSITLSGQLSDLENIAIGLNQPETLSVSVQIFDQQIGGNLLYTENFTRANSHPVIVDKGFFNVQLGTIQPQTLLQNTIRSSNNLWVEVSVDNDILTRTPITGSPYIFLNPSQSTKLSAK